MAGQGPTLAVAGVRAGGREFLKWKGAAMSGIPSSSRSALVRDPLGAVHPAAPQRVHRQLAPSHSFLRGGHSYDQNMFGQRLSAWFDSDWWMTIS